MAIHINLLAEAQAAEELRRRDPVKRAIFIGSSLVVLALVWSGMVEVNVILAREGFTGVQTAIAARTNADQHAMVDQRSVDLAKTRLAALDKLQMARFLQGNLFNALQQATVDGVQLTRLRLDQSYFLTEGTDNQTNGDRIIYGRPPTIRERITVHLNARDFSANPGDQVNKFMAAITKQSYFHAMLDKTNGVQLTSPPSAPQTDGGKPYVLFELECRYPDQIR
jgi:hypothetical protein